MLPYLKPTSRPYVWAIVNLSAKGWDRVSALEKLLSNSSVNEVPAALILIKQTKEGEYRFNGFQKLVETLPSISDGVLSELIEVIETLKVPDKPKYENYSLEFQQELVEDAERRYISAWIKLVPHLPKSKLQDVQKIAISSTAGNSMALLQEIALHLPLPEAMSIIQTFRSLEYRLETLKRLAEQSPKNSFINVYTLWKTSLRLLVEKSHKRKELLTALEWLTPVIKELGMQEGLSSTLQGIQHVVKWYP